MVLRALGIIGALLLSSSLSAQSASPAVATFNPELRASANGVRDAAHARDLGLRRFDVSIEMRGAVTETTIDAAFANPTSDMLEGDFRLKLPAGAVVTGYALDISGTMVDGVLVDRPRAKAVYDARVRRGVDPGLAEVTPDNLFETHINPIRPHGERRIRVRFVTPLGVGGLRLPLDVAPPTEGWSIAVHATGVEAAPGLSLSAQKVATFERSTDGYTAKLVGGAAALEGELRVTPASMPDTLVSEHRSGERDVQLGGALVAPPASVSGGRLRIYWDRSRSRLSSDLDGEIGLARRVIERMHPASIELVAFNSSGAERTTAQSADAAAAWLKALVYRGATSYAPLVHDAATDRCLLFSDGGPTIDRGMSFSPPCRLDAVSSASNADEAWLRHAASSHGGTAAKLDKDNGEQLADMLGGPRPGVVGVTDQDGRLLSFVPLDAGAGRWSLLARAPDGGPISVRLTDAEGARTIVRSVDGPALPFDGAATLIAADTLATLGATEQRDAYVALSRRYGIASPSLSFLVLETPADYIAAKVEPPADYPSDARDTYLRTRKMQEIMRVKS